MERWSRSKNGKSVKNERGDNLSLMNIEAERGRLGMPKNKLAEALGVTPETYNKYIFEKTPIPSDILVKMCMAFQCSSDYLLGLQPDRGREK